MKDSILNTQQSIHTRLKWSIDFNCEFDQKIVDWEYFILEYYAGISRTKIIDLVLQCRVVGLFTLANEIEASLGKTTDKENKLIYSNEK